MILELTESCWIAQKRQLKRVYPRPTCGKLEKNKNKDLIFGFLASRSRALQNIPSILGYIYYLRENHD